MDINRIIRDAAEAGKIILENGGETYRAEETISRICSSYDIKDSESYVTPTVAIVSASNEYGRTVSIIRRIKSRCIDLNKVHRVNDLSRTIKEKGATLESVENELENIKNTGRYSNKINILGSCLAAGFFTLVFGGSIYDFIVSFAAGGVVKIITILMENLRPSDFFINTIGGAAVALIALISAHLFPVLKADNIIVGGIMLLVPGIAIVNAVRDSIAGELVAGVCRTAEAFILAAAIAIGAGIVIKLWIVLFGGY